MGFGNVVNDFVQQVGGKGGGAPPPPDQFGGKGGPAVYDNYTPSYSYAAGPSYGNYQMPYSSGPFGSNHIPTPGGVSVGQKGGTMSPGFQPPGRMLGTLNYGRYPGSGIGYYDPTPAPNYNPSRGYGGAKPTPPVQMPYPVMPGPPAKGLPTPAVQPPQTKGGAF